MTSAHLMLWSSTADSMKLRVRVPGSSDTHRVATPEICNLGTLRQLLLRLLPAGTSPQSVRLSLNNRDELASASDGQTLQSAGICAGDLVYVLGDGAPTSQAPVQSRESSEDARRARCLQAAEARAGSESAVSAPANVPWAEANGGGAAGDGQDDSDYMPMDDDSPQAAASSLPPPTAPAVPELLRRVFASASAQPPQQALAPTAALGLALHAAMLDAGFVDASDAAAPLGTSACTTMQFKYALPSAPAAHIAWLRITSIGGEVVAYGGLVATPDDVLRVALPTQRYHIQNLPADAPAGALPFAQLPALWMTAKDGMAAPLLRWACLQAGLVPPIPSLLSLPEQVKHLVLGALPAQALAAVACVCRDLRFAASDEALWRALYHTEFAGAGGGGPLPHDTKAIVAARGWRVAFGFAWRARVQAQRRAAMAADMRRRRPRPHIFPVPGMPLPPVPGFPGGFPSVIGGDYDLFPGGRGGGGGFGLSGGGGGFGGGRGMFNLNPGGGRGLMGAPPHGPGRLFRQDDTPY